jgi:hypothetical protein
MDAGIALAFLIHNIWQESRRPPLTSDDADTPPVTALPTAPGSQTHVERADDDQNPPTADA